MDDTRMMVLMGLIVVQCASLHLTKAEVIFTLYDDIVTWATAKSRCESLGQRLAVLDTTEKRAALQEQFNTSEGYIGFHDAGNNDVFVWLNGKVLTNDHPNWDSGQPHHGGQNCGYLRSNGKFTDGFCTNNGVYICETGGVHRERPQVFFTLHDESVNWDTAKSRCEELGHRLAVLDTVEKRTTLQAQVTSIHTVSTVWIGFRASGNVDLWLNGNGISADHPNWRGPDPVSNSQDCGLMATNGEFLDGTCIGPLRYICEQNVCNSGYKFLQDGFCVKDITFGTYYLEQRNEEVTSSELISVQVDSKKDCTIECLRKNCNGFSFHQQPPDVGTCKMTFIDSVTYQTLEGAEFYRN